MNTPLEPASRSATEDSTQAQARPLAGATVIPAIAVPISLVGTFAVMKMLSYSLDNLSLMALR